MARCLRTRLSSTPSYPATVHESRPHGLKLLLATDASSGDGRVVMPPDPRRVEAFREQALLGGRSDPRRCEGPSMDVFVVYITVGLGIVWVALRRVRPVSMTWRLVAVLLAVGFVIGQLSVDGADTYPFVPWNMYAKEYPPRVFYEVRAIYRGREARIDWRGLFPFAPGPLPGYSPTDLITFRFVTLRNRCQCESGNSALDRGLRAVADLYGASSRDPVTAMELIETSFSLSVPTTYETTVLYRVELTSRGSRP